MFSSECPFYQPQYFIILASSDPLFRCTFSSAFQPLGSFKTPETTSSRPVYSWEILGAPCQEQNSI